MLELKDVSFTYKGASKAALQSLNFSLEQGQILGLLGVNGAGKSTLVSLVAGLFQASKGTVLLDGQPVYLGRQDLAYVPQEYAFYEQLTLGQNLNYFAQVQGLSKDERDSAIQRVLEECQISHIIDQRAIACSGGEKRRLNLAISLLRIPKLLILDEPTASVDPHARAAIIRLVQKLNQQGVTIIYTSHLLHEVESLCTSVVLIHGGRLVCEGSMQALLNTEANGLHIQCESVSINEAEKLQAAIGQGLSLDRKQASIFIDLDACDKSLGECLNSVVSLGLNILTVDSRKRDLESIFLRLTQGVDELDSLDPVASMQQESSHV